MKNRKLILIVSLVLAMTMSLGGTLAYLQDTDADVNVMTLGSVTIEHQQYERSDAEPITIDGVQSYVLQEFTQNKPLLPTTELNADGTINNFGAGPYVKETIVRMTQVDSYGSMEVFKSPLAVDKFVTVENTGKSDAYVRTFIAFEAGSVTSSKDSFESLVRSSYHTTWEKKFVDFVNINGYNYAVYEYNYKGAQLSDGSYRHQNGILPDGETTYPNLSQVYMTSAAENKDVVALDGNANGTYDILVLSQAIQADGWTDAKTALDTGFGEANTTNIKAWFEGDEEIKADMPAVTVVNVSTAKASTGNNGIAEEYTINITADIDMTGKNFSAIVAQRGDKLIVKGNGYTISNVNIVSGADDNTTGQASMFYCYPGSTLEVSNLTLKNVTVNADANDTGYASAVIGYCEGNAILNNVDVVNAKVTGVKSSGMMIGHIGNGGTLTATGCNLNGTVTLAQYAGEAAGHYAGKYIGTLAGPVTLTKCTASVTVSGALKEGNGADGDVYGRKVDPGSLTVN